MLDALLIAGADVAAEAHHKTLAFTALDLAFCAGACEASRALHAHAYGGQLAQRAAGGLSATTAESTTTTKATKRDTRMRSKVGDTKKIFGSRRRLQDFILRFMNRMGLVERADEAARSRVVGRAAFDALAASAHIDWSQPLPFTTCSELLDDRRSCAGRPTSLRAASADDRIECVRNLAKASLDAERRRQRATTAAIL